MTDDCNTGRSTIHKMYCKYRVKGVRYTPKISFQMSAILRVDFSLRSFTLSGLNLSLV